MEKTGEFEIGTRVRWYRTYIEEQLKALQELDSCKQQNRNNDRNRWGTKHKMEKMILRTGENNN